MHPLCLIPTQAINNNVHQKKVPFFIPAYINKLLQHVTNFSKNKVYNIDSINLMLF